MSFLSNNPPAYDVLPKVRDIMKENLVKRGKCPDKRKQYRSFRDYRGDLQVAAFVC
jgi:hypothetical protein